MSEASPQAALLAAFLTALAGLLVRADVLGVVEEYRAASVRFSSRSFSEALRTLSRHFSKMARGVF